MIRSVQAAYNVAGDRFRLDELAATFTEDGVLQTPTDTFSGRAGIVAGLGRPRPEGARRPTFVRHHLTTSKIDVTGADTAEGRTYFMVFTDIGPDHAGFYQDRLVRTAEGWRIAERKVRIDWVSPDSFSESLKGVVQGRLDARGSAGA